MWSSLERESCTGFPWCCRHDTPKRRAWPASLVAQAGLARPAGMEAWVRREARVRLGAGVGARARAGPGVPGSDSGRTMTSSGSSASGGAQRTRAGLAGRPPWVRLRLRAQRARQPPAVPGPCYLRTRYARSGRPPSGAAYEHAFSLALTARIVGSRLVHVQKPTEAGEMKHVGRHSDAGRRAIERTLCGGHGKWN